MPPKPLSFFPPSCSEEIMLTVPFIVSVNFKRLSKFWIIGILYISGLKLSIDKLFNLENITGVFINKDSINIVEECTIDMSTAFSKSN